MLRKNLERTVKISIEMDSVKNGITLLKNQKIESATFKIATSTANTYLSFSIDNQTALAFLNKYLKEKVKKFEKELAELK